MAVTTRANSLYETSASPLDLGPLPRPTQMPINPTERKWRMHRGMRTVAGCARDALQVATQSAGRMYSQVRSRASKRYSRLSQQTGELMGQTRFVARYARQQYPVRVLGVIAASAFVVGIGLRIWRSRQS